MGSGLANFASYLRFLSVPPTRRRIVIYSEGAASWPHLGPVLEALLQCFEGEMAYVSSSAEDPGIKLDHPNLHRHVIGDAAVRTIFFSGLQADLVLMTMPDLHTFHIKRSTKVKCYAYLHHSLVSSHMAYRAGAFDHFDALLCAGPHHEAELRAREAKSGLAAKLLLRHGYGRLDAILSAADADLRSSQHPTLLVAPSWGANGLIEAHSETLLAGLENCTWQVVVRPHPQTLKLAPHAVDRVRMWCSKQPSQRILETGVAGHESLRRADVMLSDWSGAAFDYALGLERPVLFVDVPRKINNPDYESIGLAPIEVFGREQIGRVIATRDLANLKPHLDGLRADLAARVVAIRAFRERWVYNVGRSAEAGAKALLQLL